MKVMDSWYDDSDNTLHFSGVVPFAPETAEELFRACVRAEGNGLGLLDAPIIVTFFRIVPAARGGWGFHVAAAPAVTVKYWSTASALYADVYVGDLFLTRVIAGEEQEEVTRAQFLRARYEEILEAAVSVSKIAAAVYAATPFAGDTVPADDAPVFVLTGHAGQELHLTPGGDPGEVYVSEGLLDSDWTATAVQSEKDLYQRLMCWYDTGDIMEVL